MGTRIYASATEGRPGTYGTFISTWLGGGTILTIGWELAKHPYGIATIFVAFPASMVLLILVSACTSKK